MRDISAPLLAALSDNTAQKFFAIDISFTQLSSQNLRLWTGDGDIEIGGNTFLGTSLLAKVYPLGETAELHAGGIKLELAGLPLATIAAVRASSFQGNPATVMIGAVNQSNVLIGTYNLFKGFLDQMEIRDGGSTATVNISVESKLITWGQPREITLTPERQKQRFPGDTGLDFVTDIQGEIIWGR